MSKQNKSNRVQFSSKFGVIAATVGSAVGLGNIWKFPYITGEYGGGAFLIAYLIFIVLIGMPIMLSEFIIGRKTHKNVFGAFKELAPRSLWRFTGLLSITAVILILSFYGVVAGWSIEYVIASISNDFNNKTPEQLQSMFTNLTSEAYKPIIYQLIFMALTGYIVMAGVKNGIEKSAKIMMPMLFVIIIALNIRAITLPNSEIGLEFLFKPDFSKLTSNGILSALGHAFFSLSLALGTLITFSSYMSNNSNLTKITAEVSIADTIIAILAGVAILPAVFAFGLNPSQGPGLVFITLPNVFEQMPGGYFFSILFFMLLTIAALTSSVSLLEVVVAFFSEEIKINRKKATFFATIGISIIGMLCSLSMGPLNNIKFFGLNLFDSLDWIASNIMLPVGGLLTSIFVGWKLGPKVIENELLKGGKPSKIFINSFIFICKWIAPVAISLVLLNEVGLFKLI